MGAVFVEAYRRMPGVKPTGDRLYEQVRDNRYQWFGKRDRLYESAYPLCEADVCARAFDATAPSADA
jgi:predicted DCC family thiol-disulfide oxidoreductase YuxK